MFLLVVKLNIIEIAIPPILERTNIEDITKKMLKKSISISVAALPTMQNRINLERCFVFLFIVGGSSKFL